MSQNQNSVWCFGHYAGIDFKNAASPQTITSPIISRGTACSISDSSGNLLFSAAYDTMILYVFFEAGKVYDKFGNIMQNGDSLAGDGWYQDMVIVPDPANQNLYYLFSIGVTSFSGLYYSTIDMTQNGGLGAVMQKNVQLDSLLSNDGIIAVKHANGRDWWLFYTYYWNNPNNNFHVYLITPNGIDSPIVQSVGTINPGNNLTHFTFSKDGSQFSMVNNISQIDLFDFDRCTGIISHHASISLPDPTPPWHNYQGSAFSASGQYLYVADFDTVSHLYQFDVLASNIAASKIIIDSFIYPEYCGGFLKLAPDNKIYMSNAYNDGINFNYPYADTVYNMYNMNLSVINQPDSAGLACNFTKYSFYLGGNRTYWGLPNNPDYTLGAVTGSVCDSLTSVAEILVKDGLEIFPNPVTCKLNIAIKQQPEIVEVCIYNLLGEKCLYLKTKTFGSKITIDVSSLKQGMYLLIVEDKMKRRGVRKFVKQ